MKRFPDYKKLFSFIFLGFLLPALFVFAQTVQELESKIGQKNVDIDKLEVEIAKYQDELNALGTQKSSLARDIKQLDLTRKKLSADISVTENKIEKTNLKIQELGFEIGDKEEIINTSVNALKLDIKRTNELELDSIPEKILSQNRLADVWLDIDTMILVRDRIREKITEVKQVKIVLEDSRKQTTEARNELALYKSELADQKKIVDQNTSQKNKLLSQTKNSESAYQKLLKDRLAKKEAFEKELRAYEEQLKFVLDPSKLPGKGTLSWPLDKIFVTQMFGKTSSSGRLYASGTHSGVDFRAAVGTPVKSMADGVVEATGDTDITCPGASFGKFVFIRYNNGLASAFGHLSLIKSTPGQKVSRGEVVGYSGNTGHSTGPHLHVTVYAGQAVKVQSRPSAACGGKSYTMPVAATNAYLDPMFYLPPYKQ